MAGAADPTHVLRTGRPALEPCSQRTRLVSQLVVSLRIVALGAWLIALVGCSREGDHCEVYTEKCEGDELFVCHRAGGKDDLIQHRSNFYDRSSCTPRRCVQVGSNAACAVDDTRCDPVTFAPTVKRVAGGKLEIVRCDVEVGDVSFRSSHQWTACDPATFRSSPIDGEMKSTCARADDTLADARRPRELGAFGGYYIEWSARR